MLNEDALIECNRRGLICGPMESEESFYLRVERSTKREDFCILSESLFDIYPDWVPIIFKKEGLKFWEGGCAWLDQDRVVLQFKPSFKIKKTRLFGYSQQEILAHECVHAARSQFHESRFEEILAYQTSSSRFRRFFGPLFRNTKEVICLFVAVLAGMCAELLEWPLLATIPWIFVSLFTVRLFYAQRVYAKARLTLEKCIGAKRAPAVLLRLTDREISKFARMAPIDILLFAQSAQKTDLRWKQIFLSYFPYKVEPVSKRSLAPSLCTAS